MSSTGLDNVLFGHGGFSKEPSKSSMFYLGTSDEWAHTGMTNLRWHGLHVFWYKHWSDTNSWSLIADMTGKCVRESARRKGESWVAMTLSPQNIKPADCIGVYQSDGHLYLKNIGVVCQETISMKFNCSKFINFNYLLHTIPLLFLSWSCHSNFYFFACGLLADAELNKACLL